MKKLILIFIASIGISFYLPAQSAGDYRSIANGNWNDATNWERYSGNSWVSTTTYPGQNPGTGAVTIKILHEIRLTSTVPHPIASLLIDQVYDYPAEGGVVSQNGIVVFSSENPVALTVSGDVVIAGELNIDNQNGAKTHELFIGRNFIVSEERYDPNCGCHVTRFQTINQDDKLGVTFNSTDPSCLIISNSRINFHDITFNCAGTLFVYTNIGMFGTATFINGIVRPMEKDAYNGSDLFLEYDITFGDGSIVSGGSNVSFIEGRACKYGVEPFTFPIGHEGFYAPLTISAIDQPEYICASYNRNNGDWAQPPITDPELLSVNTCDLWSVFRYNNDFIINTSIDVTVGWTSPTPCGSFHIANVSDIVLANFDGSTWNRHGGTSTGTTTNGSVTWSGYNFGSFSLGNVGTDCITPSGLNSTNITTNSATVSWSAVPGAVSYDVDLKAQSSSIWINEATATTSTSANLSGLNPSVIYEWRVRANCGSASSLYKQTQFTTTQPPPPTVCNDVYETNNTSSQAKTISLGVTISAGISSASDVDWFKITTPNNSNTHLEVTLSNLIADYDLYVYNKSLKLIGSSTNSGTSNEVVSYNSNARKATYYIRVIGKNGAFNTSYCYSLLAQVSSSPARSASNASIPQKEINEGLSKQMLYPNPASEFVYLNFNSATEGLVNIQIVNSIGQLVKQHPVNTIKGHNQIKIQVADIRPGMYILRINKGDLNLTRKFVIAR